MQESFETKLGHRQTAGRMDSPFFELDPDYVRPPPKPNGYRRLAIAVLTRALRDFVGLDHDDLGRLARVERVDEQDGRRRPDAALTRVRRQIDAGEFLFGQVTPDFTYWCRLAGEDPFAPRPTRLVLPDRTIEDRFAHMAHLHETKRLLEARGAKPRKALDLQP